MKPAVTKDSAAAGHISLRRTVCLLTAVLVLLGAYSCKSSEPGMINLLKLGLEDEDKIVAGEQTPTLPAPGEEIFLIVTDLGTCLDCKKAAIWVSNVWVNSARPRHLVFLDNVNSEFDIPATQEFIAEKKLRGLHYYCNAECMEKINDQLGEQAPRPAHYFIGKDGRVHWKGGFLPAYGPILKGIRSGKYDAPLLPAASAK